MQHRTKLSQPLLLAVTGAFLAACGDGADPSTESATLDVPPPVLLISLDTVRADTLSCYRGAKGDSASATPNLDAFAATADRYEACIATAPWTMPTHASMFTGLFPFEHGAHSYLPPKTHRGDNVYILHPKLETIAERLGASGYRTAGVVANAHYLRPALGLQAGFETWDVSREPADGVTKRALTWLDEYGNDPRPTLLFMNYMDAHRPYRTGDPSDAAVARLDALIDRVLVRGEAPGDLGTEVRTLHQLAVTNLDAELGKLFDALRERQMFDRSLIVITADHGESFGQHGVVEHSKDVYDDLVRVPLLVKYPGQTEGTVRTERASSVDVPGLIAAYVSRAKLPEVAAAFPRLPGEHPILTENHFSRVKDLKRYGDRFRRQRRAVYDGSLKLIVGSEGSIELYDLDADPGEQNNLADARAQDVERMSSALEAQLAATAFVGEPIRTGKLKPHELAEMNALGYGGGDDDDPASPR